MGLFTGLFGDDSPYNTPNAALGLVYYLMLALLVLGNVSGTIWQTLIFLVTVLLCYRLVAGALTISDFLFFVSGLAGCSCLQLLPR